MAVGRNVQTGNVQTDGENMSKEHLELIKQGISKELTEDEKLKLLEWLLKDSLLNNRHVILGEGNWLVVEEKVDLRVVKQQDNLSCGAACGEMLLKEKRLTVLTGHREDGFLCELK